MSSIFTDNSLAHIEYIAIIGGLVAIVASLIYLMIRLFRKSGELSRFRKRNREAQFPGSAVKENQGLFSSVFNYRGRAESLGERGDKIGILLIVTYS